MSSREIAELTGKMHKNVMRDISAMLTGLKSEPSDFEGSYIDPTGRTLPCFNLPKRETMILVSGYSIPLRARIIDRWMELEAAVAQSQPANHKIPDSSNLAEVVRVWALGRERRPFHPRSGYSHSWVSYRNY